jgi:ankyrin repeat protein
LAYGLFDHSPLGEAVSHGHGQLACRLLEQGADPHAWPTEGFNELGLACRTSQVECVRLLLEYGADPNETGVGKRQSHVCNQLREGQSGLPFAGVSAAELGTRRQTTASIARLLLDARADPRVVDEESELTALELAQEHGHPDAEAMIRAARRDWEDA